MSSIIGMSIFVGVLLVFFVFGLWLLMGGGDALHAEDARDELMEHARSQEEDV